MVDELITFFIHFVSNIFVSKTKTSQATVFSTIRVDKKGNGLTHPKSQRPANQWSPYPDSQTKTRKAQDFFHQYDTGTHNYDGALVLTEIFFCLFKKIYFIQLCWWRKYFFLCV